MWVAFLIAQVGYVEMAEYLSHPQPPPDDKFKVAMMTVALAAAVIALAVRSRTVAPAAEILKASPSDSGALGQWRKGQILSFVMAEVVVLFGFILRLMGVPWAHAAPLYAVGIGMIIFFYPRQP